MSTQRKLVHGLEFAPRLVLSLSRNVMLASEVFTNPVKVLSINLKEELSKSPYALYRHHFMDYFSLKLYYDGEMTNNHMSKLMKEFKKCDDVVKIFISRAKEISETNHSYLATILLAIYSAKVFARKELATSSESAYFLHLLSQVNDNDLRHFELIYDYAAPLEPKFTPFYACDVYYESEQNPLLRKLDPKGREAELLSRLSNDSEFVSFSTSIDKLTFLGVFMQRSASWGSIGHSQISLNPYSDTLKELLEESRLMDESIINK